PPNLTTDTTPEFAFSADEPGVQFRCRVDDGPFSDCSSPLTLAALGDGTHTFEVHAVDAAGNAEASGATRSFTIDSLPPQTAITAGPSGAIADTTPTFEFGDGEQGSRFECRVDGAAFLPCE